MVRDMADAINNYKHHAGVVKLRSQLWPDGVYSPDSNDTRETLALPPMAAIEVSRGYNSLLWVVRHRCTSIGGDSGVAWKFYVSAKLYQGPEVFDSSYLQYPQSSQIVSTSLTAQFDREWTSLYLIRNALNRVYVVLTATNQIVGMRGKIDSLDVFGVP
jgi:hypothetical protein